MSQAEFSDIWRQYGHQDRETTLSEHAYGGQVYQTASPDLEEEDRTEGWCYWLPS